MKKISCIIIISLLIITNAHSKNTKLIKENYYSDNINWNLMNYSLPEGKWKFFSKSFWQVSTVNVQCIEFNQVESKTLKGLLEICEIKNGGKFAHALGRWLNQQLTNGKYDNCKLRSEYFYAKLYSKGISMNCMRIRHIDVDKELNNPDDPDDRGRYAYLNKYFYEQDIDIPKTLIGSYHLFYSPRVRDKGIEISHFINPELFGQSKTLYASENRSEFHRENIRDYPDKLEFMNNWTINKAKFHQLFEKKMKSKRDQRLNFDDLLMED